MTDTIFEKYTPSPIQEINWPFVQTNGIRLFVKRDDLIHDEIQGNKWRKLKYNILKMKSLNLKSAVSFGGAFSNHIAALAAAGRILDFETIGIIRGDELNENANKTLRKASKDGMKLLFVDREAYRDKAFLAKKYGNQSYCIPEGGTNEEAIKGTNEIVDEIKEQFELMPDFVCTSFGTGGTAAGILQKIDFETKLLVFPALKISSQNVENEVFEFCKDNQEKLIVCGNYHFGGYGKSNATLLSFMNYFENTFAIPIEQVYTAKMFFGIFDLAKQGYFADNSVILAIHTGGLQGKIGNI